MSSIVPIVMSQAGDRPISPTLPQGASHHHSPQAFNQLVSSARKDEYSGCTPSDSELGCLTDSHTDLPAMQDPSPPRPRQHSRAVQTCSNIAKMASEGLVEESNRTIGTESPADSPAFHHSTFEPSSSALPFRPQSTDTSTILDLGIAVEKLTMSVLIVMFRSSELTLSS